MLIHIEARRSTNSLRSEISYIPRLTASKAPKQRLTDTAARSLKSLNATPGQILVRSMADIEAVTLCDREQKTSSGGRKM